MSLQPWQRANILAAANYLRELGATKSGGRPEVIHQGLLEVLDPARRVTRLQREMASAAKAAASMHERRAGRDRRHNDRRKTDLGRADGDRRNDRDRRAGADRRSRSA
jgi:hypothetical protein